MFTINKLNEVFDGGAIRRYHSIMTNRQQSNAEHQWKVAVFIFAIVDNPSKALILRSLIHDCPEILTGDIPSHVKRQNSNLRKEIKLIENHFYEDIECEELTEEETRLLKICDYIEMLSFCLSEKRCGNIMMDEIFANCNHYLLELAPLPTKAIEIIDSLTREYLIAR